MSKTAAIIGATGLVGSCLLDDILTNDIYDTILIPARKAPEIKHPKIRIYTGDLTSDSFWTFNEKVDDVFCCIGTTRAKTSELAQYKKIDMGIPVSAAQWGLRNEMKTFVVISAMGANKKSKIFYSRIKGQMEEAILKLPIKSLAILRPSLILGKREEFRLGEKIGKILAETFSFLIPAKYKGIHARTIAEVMLILASKPLEKSIYESDEIKTLVS